MSKDCSTGKVENWSRCSCQDQQPAPKGDLGFLSGSLPLFYNPLQITRQETDPGITAGSFSGSSKRHWGGTKTEENVNIGFHPLDSREDPYSERGLMAGKEQNES